MFFLGVSSWPKMVYLHIMKRYRVVSRSETVNKMGKQVSRFFYTARVSSLKGIGPHNEPIISTIIGNLLGDGWGEKRVASSGEKETTRFHIHMSSKNAEYIYWLHKFFSENGYCSAKKPPTIKQIGPKGQIYYSIKFRTFSFSSLNYIYYLFYRKDRNNKYIKTVPANIGELCTARTLAIWLMDDGSVSGSGVRISTESFTREEVACLKAMILQNFSIHATIQRHKTRWILYFPKSQLPLLSKKTKPYFIPCMYYKLNCELNRLNR